MNISNIIINSTIYYLTFNICYYVSSLTMFAIDYFGFFNTLKIQEYNYNDMMTDYKKCIPTVIINVSFHTIIPIIIITSTVNILNIDFTYAKMFSDILLATLMTDVFFYTGHWILHKPYFYKNFHKKHHEITAPIGLGALYNTAPDIYIGNIIPVYLPMIILSSHPLTIRLWMILTTFNAVVLSHSGFKGLSEFHDYHHEKFNKNYGIGIFMDYLFKTQY